MERLLSRWECDFVGPRVDNRLAIEVVEVCHDPLLEFGFRSHPDVTQDRARHLREEAFDQVKPRAMLWREHKAEAALALSGEPFLGFLLYSTEQTGRPSRCKAAAENARKRHGKTLQSGS